MTDRSLPWVAAGVLLAATFGAGLWWTAPLPAPTAADGSPHVDARVLARALGSVRPDPATLSDEIHHFEARLAARGDEAFARDRLVDAHLLRYRAYGDDADLLAAERYLDRRAASGASSPALWSARASVHLLRHEFPEAVAAAREANDRAFGQEPAYWLRLFDALWAGGRFDEAAPLLDLPIDHASIGVRSRRARVLDRRGEVARARDEFRTVVDLTRAYAEPAAVQAWALVEAGHFEHHAGDPGRGVARYLEALEVLPGSPAALEGLAAVSSGVDRDPRTAARLYRHALEQGAHLEVMLALADAEEEAGDAAEADRVRAAYVELATVDAEAERLNLRPLAQLLADDPATVCRALAYARRDVDQRQDPGAWSTLAWARFRADDLDGARRAALLATAEGSPEPAVAWRAGVILQATGETGRAHALLEAALEGESELSVAEVAEAERLLAGEASRADETWGPFGRSGCGATPPSRPHPR